MLAVTAVLAMAVNGSRSLLITAVSEEAAATGLSRFFDPGIARAIRAGGHQSMPGTAQRESAAIMNLDIRSVSRIAEHCEPDAVMRILAAYQGRVIPIVHARNGMIDKFLGDGIMVNFLAWAPAAKPMPPMRSTARRPCSPTCGGGEICRT